MSVIERPEVIVVCADTFLGNFDKQKYALLTRYADPEVLMSLVYSDHVEEFSEYMGAAEGDILLREKGETHEECVLQSLHDSRLDELNLQITLLRDEMEEFIIDSVPELKLRSVDLWRVFFNSRTAFAELGPRR